MTSSHAPPAGTPRLPIDVALIAVALSLFIAATRVAMTEGPFSDNDRSRWATIRALAENDTFALGSRALENGVLVDRGIVATPGWVSVDVVLDPATNLFYSSKPPLLAYLASFPVKACAALGFTLTEHRPVVTRVVIVLFELLPFALALVAVHRLLARRFAQHPWARACAVAMVGTASLFATFVVTLNPHVLAGAAAVVALWLVDPRSGRGTQPGPFGLMGAGFCAGLAAAFEPTALAFAAFLIVMLCVRYAPPARSLVFFLPAAALPVFAHLVTTAAVFGDAFHFFGPLKEWYRFEGSYWQTPTGVDVDDDRIFAYAFHLTFGHHGFFSITPLAAIGACGAIGFALASARDAHVVRRSVKTVGLIALSFLFARALRVVADAPWQLALVPVALCALWLARNLVLPRSSDSDSDSDSERARATVIACAMIMSIGFYVMHTSNYGGVALGPRWLLWLVPLLALGVPHALLALQERAGRVVATVVALVALVVGAALATPRGGLNPWQPPRWAAVHDRTATDAADALA